MSEMTSAVETQKQQQQYVGGSSNAEHHCKDCGLNFESEKSLEVHLRYHQENLLNQWANKAQQEESNNNHSKTGNHNSHVSANRDSVTVTADSSEPSSMSPSQDLTSSQQQAQQQQQQHQQQQQQSQQSQQQPAIHTIVCPPYDHFQTPMFSEGGYFMQNDQSYILPHHFSPSQEDGQSNGGRDGGYARYHPYQHQQLFPSDRATSNSTSPHSPPFQCEKCGAVYEDTNQLGEHMRTNHLDSPTAYPSAPQYQQLGNSPQQPSQQLHSSPPLSNQSQQQSGYDYNGGQTIKTEMKQEQPEEQAEILDLDSHKVQTHRYEEEIMRMQQQQHQQHQGLQMQMHHQQVMQQQQQPPQRMGSLTVSSMLSWPPTIQTHDYAGHPSMGSINNVPPIADQDQYMRGQHMPVEHGHQGSPIITSTQPMSGHQVPAGFVQQTAKAPPLANQSWKSNEPRRPKTYNCTACNKWFTSSGHLKRHYNTTLHKNAVKNGKEPDPATMPITAHHHPTRENSAGHSTGGRGGGAPARSPPELSSSRSPPNLMAGPSGEATGGLLHTPTTLCNNNSNSNNSNNDSLVLVQRQQQQQQQLVHLGIINSPVSSPLAGHHQQQMGTASHQLGLQQQQQQPHLPTDSSGQPVHHSTTSPTMPPPAASHMNCPSPMGSSSHPVHHMNSPLGSGHPAMTSPTAMGGTTMPHQPYPNALPPHVTITTPAAPLESTQAATIMQLPTIGNGQDERHSLLPGFKTILPSFTEFGFVVEQNQLQAVNVGGLNVEEIAPQESFESSASTYDPFSPLRYKSLNNSDMTTLMNADGMIQDQDMEITLYTYQSIDAVNNNHLSQLGQAKEDLDPNVGLQTKKQRKSKGSANKQRQIITTGANCISQNGIHKCLDCNKYFNKACYLTQHNKSFHSGDKPFKCTQCGKRFPNEELHKKHTEMHTLARKHQCDVCPKLFAHKTDLKRHICIHTGKRPFSCDVCGKGFIRQDHMKKHQDTHNKKQRIQSQRQAVQRLSSARPNTQRANAQRPNTVQRSNMQRLQTHFTYLKL